jgi:membrane associated rhomboid family serine protease
LLWFVFFLTEFPMPWLKAYGLRPRSIDGLIGILTYPLLHGDLSHIAGNSVTAFVLLTLLFGFYKKVSFKVLFWSWTMSGTWMWIAARDANHIGFSGVIYALAAFIFFSGMFSRYFRMMALSGVIVFLYGSMIWGVLPIQPGVSWEGHLFGAIAGVILAYYYREAAPKRPKYSWEFDPDEETDLPWNQFEIESKEEIKPKRRPLSIRYLYKSNKDK